MKCTDVRENLAAFLDGEIEGAPRRAVDAHLAACPACREEARSQAAAWRLLDMAGDAPPAPAGLRERILSRARGPGSGSGRGGRVLRLPLPAAAAAAAVLLAAGGTTLWLGRTGRPAAPSPEAPPDQLLENLAMLESLDLLQDEDVTVADSLADYPVEDLETLGG